MSPELKAALREELKRIIDVGVPASVRSTWPVIDLDNGNDTPARDPEYAAEHFHKYWTPKLYSLLTKALQPEIERLVDLEVNKARLEEHTALTKIVIGKSDSEIARWSLERSTPYSKYLHKLTQSNQKKPA